MAKALGRRFAHAVAFIVVTAAAAVSPTKLPKGFMKCRLSDPALNDCLLKGFELALPYLAKGVPSLGLLPIDPMRINLLEVDNSNGPVKFKIKFKNMDILNQQTARPSNVTADTKNYVFKFNIKTEKPITLEGMYEASGMVLVLPIVGNGTFKMSLDDYSSMTTLEMKPVVKQGHTHLHVEKLSWNFTTSRFHIRLNNLFNGNKILGENMNVFLNENWKEILDEMNPAFVRALSTAYTLIIQQFFNRVPLDEMFLD